jgi:hypothetical protein
MAFPVIQTTSQNSLVAGTTHSITLPSGIQAGDLLLVFFATDGDNTITDSQTFTVLGSQSNGTNLFTAVLYKIAVGSDTLTITTSISEPSSHVCYRIDGWESTFAPELSTVNGAWTEFPNSLILTPTWSQDDTLWISVAGGDRYETVDSYPSNYTLQQKYEGGGGNQDCNVSVAGRNLNASNEDPGQFDMSGTDQWIAWTIGVAPSGATAPAGTIDELMGIAWDNVDVFMGIEDINIDEVMGVDTGE